MFALTHQFLQQLIEGDELYTRVNKNVAPDESQGWTIVLMDRATRFLWEMHCGRKERKLFKQAMELLCEVIQQTSPRSRSQVEPYNFCVRRGDFSQLEAKDGQKCPFKDGHVVAIMLTTPCRVSGGHSLLIPFDQNPPPMGIPTLARGLGYSPLRKKIPRVHLVPLNVGSTNQRRVDGSPGVFRQHADRIVNPAD